MAGDLDAIQIDSVTVDGGGHTLSGVNQYRGLFIGAPNGGSYDPSRYP